MTIITPKSLRSEISAVAKASYPNEVFAFLLGTKRGNKYFVQKLYFPPSTSDSTEVRLEVPATIIEALEEASEHGLELLGDIHSHPNFIDASPSEGDWDNYKSFEKFYISDPVMGILAIYKNQNGQLRTRLRYWPWLKQKICQKIL